MKATNSNPREIQQTFQTWNTLHFQSVDNSHLTRYVRFLALYKQPTPTCTCTMHFLSECNFRLHLHVVLDAQKLHIYVI